MHGTYTFGLAHSQGMETAVCSLLWYCCGRGIQRRSQKLSPGPISTTGTAESEWDNRITQQRCLIEQELGEHRKTSYNTGKQCNLLLVVRGMLLLWVHENIQMLTVCGASQEASWLPVSSFLAVCCHNASIRGEADFRWAGAPWNAQHTPFKM